MKKFSLDDLRISVIDTNTDSVISEISPNDIVSTELWRDREVTFSVEILNSDLADQVKSARLTLGDDTKVENFSPYALFGNIDDDFTGGQKYGAGDFGLKVEFFGSPNARGTKLFEQTASFSAQAKSEPVMNVSKPAAASGADKMAVYIIDIDTGERLVELDDGEGVPASLIAGRNIGMIAEPLTDQIANQIDTVRLSFGDQVRTEAVAPYALFGDVDGDFLGGLELGRGGHEIKIEAFSSDGRRLLSETTDFTLQGGGSNPAPSPQPAPAPSPEPAPAPEPVIEPTPAPQPSIGKDVYQGKNGRIVMEAENGDASGEWARKSVDGETVMLWDAAESSYRSVPRNEQISFEFQTDEGGNYNIALHSARDKSTMSRDELFENGRARTDTGNDVYVRIKNAETGEVIVEPTKLFTNLGSSNKELRWGSTFDANDEKSAAKVRLDGDTKYELDIIGRSDGYVFDRVTLDNESPFTNANAAESARGGGNSAPTTPPSPGPTASADASDNSVGTDNDFNGVRLWIGNDISEIDDAASSPSLFLGARNIANSDGNITGSASKMTLEGGFIDTVRSLDRNWIDEVEEGVNTAAQRFGIDVYSPRGDIDIGGDKAQFERAMTKSFDTAFANNEQMIVVTGGPSRISAEVFSDWLEAGSTETRAEKAVWALKGGFSQVTHGDTVKSNNVLDKSRDASKDYFNINDNGDPGHIQAVFYGAYQKAEEAAKDGIGSAFTRSEYEDIKELFVEDSLLISLEDQNANSAVRGSVSGISATIGDDLAREYASQYDKPDGIDISDVGLLGILVEGDDPFNAQDMRTYLAEDFMG